MKNINIKQFDLSLWALVFSLIVVLYINFHYTIWNQTEKVIGHDTRSYYAYLPATFIYHDLSLEFLKGGGDKLGKQFWGKKSPTGHTVIITSYGMSMLYSPFFIMAHSSAQLLGYPADGYSKPYYFALLMSSIFYLMLGAVFLRKFLIKYYPKPIVAITLLVVILATNMLWYVTFEATMTHVYSFALISLFVYMIDRWIESLTFKQTIIIGLLVGVISLVRPTNAVVVVLLIFWKVTSWKGLVARISLFIKKWHLILIMIVMALIVWVPQLIYWKYVSGSYIFYSYPDKMRAFFLNPQLLNTMFSWRKGLLIYTPIMAFAFVGIGMLFNNIKEFFWPVLIYFLVSWYIISSWWDWWYGGSFSMRPFIDSYGIYSIGFATFLTWVFKTKRLPKTILLSIFVLFSVIGIWHFKKYYGGSIHWAYMTKEAYFDSFWRVHPTGEFYQKLRKPDYELALKGIYKYEDERINTFEE
ncbi:MAG: hypothetical protein Q8O72_10215 [Bacteroidales bacterium]|nr:hypothetical protein [Bacteroidales bacterium]